VELGEEGEGRDHGEGEAHDRRHDLVLVRFSQRPSMVSMAEVDGEDDGPSLRRELVPVVSPHTPSHSDRWCGALKLGEGGGREGGRGSTNGVVIM
jgi:hypothetical protein